jgi:hypothetical protein
MNKLLIVVTVWDNISCKFTRKKLITASLIFIIYRNVYYKQIKCKKTSIKYLLTKKFFLNLFLIVIKQNLSRLIYKTSWNLTLKYVQCYLKTISFWHKLWAKIYLNISNSIYKRWLLAFRDLLLIGISPLDAISR